MNRKLHRRDKAHVWKDEDGDWVWLCRNCWAAGTVERDQPTAFGEAHHHATRHVIIGFQR